MDKKKSLLAVIITFYGIAISLRYLTNKTSFLSSVDNLFLKTVLQGIGPAIGAIITFKLFSIPWVMTLKGDFKKIYIPLVIFWGLPIFVITVVAYFKNGTLPYGLVLSVLIYGLLEEIGWRGFLQQVLKPLPKSASILIVAVLWFVWHLNFELSTSNLIFFGILILGSWGIGKVADRTNSLLAVAAFHSLNNFFTEMDVFKIAVLVTLILIWIPAIMYMDKPEKKTSINKGFFQSGIE